MLNIQLYIEGEEVDLFDDESVTLTQTIQNVMDIEKVFTDFSKTFNVPASKNNNKIFKHFHNPNIIGFDARYKKDAELHLNYKLFKKGKIKLEGATRKDNKAHTYKLTFFGNTISLKDLIGEDKLDALTYINKYFTFEYTNSNIKLYMENGLDVTVGDEVFTDAIIFPLITHTKRLIYDSGHDANNVNTETTNNIAYINNADYGLEISQLKPALKVHAIIKAIESQYNLEFSTDFFSTTNDVYNKLYLWLHNKTGAISTGEISESFADNFQFSENDGNVVLKPGGFQLTGANAKSLNVVVRPTSNNPFNVVVYRDGEELARYDNVSLNYRDNTEWSLATQIGGHLQGLVQGNFQIAIESETANTFDLRHHIHYVSGAFKRSRDTYFSASTSVGININVKAARQMPDIKVIDFLTGLFKMFNLTAFRRDDGIVEVKTLDDFYGDSTKIWDVTPHIDKTSQEVNTVLPYKQIDFSYKGSESFLAKSFEEITKKKWGALHHNIDRKFDGQIYKVELPFEHFQFERLSDVNDGSKTTIQWGWSADIKQEAFVGEPLLFYPILNSGTFGIVDIDGVVSQKTQYYQPSNSIALEDSFNINFKAEYNEYSDPTIPYNNTLFESYYKNYISEVFDPQKRLTKTKAYLPMSMLMEFTLADKLRIFDILYRINKITTNFETMQSDLELINSREIFGERISVTPIVPDEFIPVNRCITVDNTQSIDTLYHLTADVYCDVEGFDIISTNEVVPNDLDPGNKPKYNDTFGEVILVTPPVIQTVTPIYVTATEIFLAFNVAQLGKIGEVSNIDELGFFYSTNEDDLESTNIDTLKETSGVTNIPFVQNDYTKHQDRSEFRESAKVGNLTSGTTLYWRFYGRTNLDPQYSRADAISEIQTSTTT